MKLACRQVRLASIDVMLVRTCKTPSLPRLATRIRTVAIEQE